MPPRSRSILIRRLSAGLALVALLAGLASATANAAFFPGDAIDGPSSAIAALGDVDMARDGTGALVYVRDIGGVDRVVVARFERGVFQPPEQIDATLAGPSSQPVIGAADNGRLAIAFVSAGTVYGVVRPSGQPYGPPTLLGPGSDPSVDLSINGTAFASFTSSSEDVRIARLDRRTNAWTGLAQAVDIDPARPAGVGNGRSRVAISADGIGVVTWGEASHVFARKMFNDGISNAPQDLTPPTFGDRVSAVSDLPDVDAEDDSSYAWVVWRQHFVDGGSRTLARRQRGTGFDPAVAVDTGDEPVRDPRIDINGRGRGLATSAGAVTGQPLTALIDNRDVFGAGGRILAPSPELSAAVPAISENNTALVAAVLAGAGAPAIVGARPYTDGRAGTDVALSRPEFGPVDPELGFEAASDRAGGTVVAWVQGALAERRIVAGVFDRAPAKFVGYTGQRCCRGVRPLLKWQPAFDLWGALRYDVLVDGVQVGQTTGAPAFTLAAPLKSGTHTWQVRAVDIRGQATRSRTRKLRIDGYRPLLGVRYKRRKRVVTLSVRARDDTRSGRLAAGMQRVVVSWGDRTPVAAGSYGVALRHRYRHKGTYELTVLARDRAGNETVDRRTVRIG